MLKKSFLSLSLTSFLVVMLCTIAFAANLKMEMLNHHNTWRAERGLNPMTIHQELMEAATTYVKRWSSGTSSNAHLLVIIDEAGYNGISHASLSMSQGRVKADRWFGYLSRWDNDPHHWYTKQLKNPEHIHLGLAQTRLRKPVGNFTYVQCVIYGHGEVEN